MGQQQSQQDGKRRRRNTTLAAGFVTGSSGRVEEKYTIDMKPLGRGHYGVVRRCVNIETGQEYAMKTIRKARVSRVESLLREVQILRKVSHPNIIELADVYEDEMNLHLVTELCTGGELFERILEKTESEEGRYSERDAMMLVTKILSAIAYCHDEHNICHRDLKPENFLFKDRADDAELKIIDFGLSRFEDTNAVMTTRVGTPYYIAPEVLGRSYTKACDLWSIGVIAYILLCGYPPFYGKTDKEIFCSVRRGEYDFPGPEWDTVSDEAKAFVRRLLVLDPNERPAASEALNLPWLHALDTDIGKAVENGDAGEAAECATAAATTAARMDKPLHLSSRLRRFTGMSNLKRAALSVIANQLTEADIGSLRDAFREIDADNNGSICVDELKMVVKKEGLEYIEEEVVEMMRGVDVDGSDSIEWEEFLAATIDRNVVIREDNVRRAFEYFDVEGSGSITFANLVQIFGSEDHAREIVGAGDIDLNGDGEISFDEFRQMMEEDHTTTNTRTSSTVCVSPPSAAGTGA
ncbi:unnamed protein product [Scytosiphon promiscuus]